MELIQIYFTKEERELIRNAVSDFSEWFNEPDEECVRICKVINNTLN